MGTESSVGDIEADLSKKRGASFKNRREKKKEASESSVGEIEENETEVSCRDFDRGAFHCKRDKRSGQADAGSYISCQEMDVGVMEKKVSCLETEMESSVG